MVVKTEEKTEAVVEEKTADEKVEEKVEGDKTAEELGAEFDKKVEGEEHTAYTETPEEKEAEEAKAKTEADEKEADEKSSKEVPAKEVDDILLERAIRVGLSMKRAREFSNNEDLERAVTVLEDSQTEKQTTVEDQKAKEEAEARAKEDEAPYDCGLDPEEYDEGLIKVLNELGTNQKKRIVELEKALSTQSTSLSSNQANQYTQWLDSRINHLDEDLKEVYGEGEIDDIEPDSEQFSARATLDRTITKIVKEHRDAQKRVPSRNKLFDMAIESLHKGKTKTKADDKTKAKLKARAKEALGAGSGRVSAETLEQKALQVNKDFDKKIDEE